MITVGIKELKANLSAYVKQVEEGEEVVITDRGREVAIVVPLSEERRAVKGLMAAGTARWAGGKPKGVAGVSVAGRPVAETLLEDRR